MFLTCDPCPGLAQWVEHWTCNLRVMGSSPTRSSNLSLWLLVVDICNQCLAHVRKQPLGWWVKACTCELRDTGQMDWVPLCSWHKATNQTCPVAITCYHTLHCIISIWHVISYTVLMSLNHSKLIANISLLKIPCGKTDSFWPVWQVVSKTSNFVINPVEQTEGFFLLVSFLLPHLCVSEYHTILLTSSGTHATDMF